MVDGPRRLGSAHASAKKTYLVITLFVGIVLCLLMLDLIRAEILNSVRAYVVGESLWSKGQKDAVQHLIRYSASHAEADYQAFLNAIAIPLGDRQARLELETPEPDLNRIYQGFAAGGNSPEDAKAMAVFFRRYHRIDHVARAIEIWAEADRRIAALLSLADSLHTALSWGSLTAEQVSDIQKGLTAANRHLALLEEEFSRTLGEAAHWANSITQQLIYLAVGLLLSLGTLVSLWVIKSMTRAETAARESDERFRLLVKSVKDYAIFMLDPDGRVTSWNSGAQAIKGYRAEEIIGQPFSRFYTPEDTEVDIPRKTLAAAVSQGRLEQEGWRVRKDGSRFWANAVLTALYDDGGRLRGFAKVMRDITERKHSEERFRWAVEAAPNAMILAREDGRIVLINAQAERLFGYSRDELQGELIERLVPERFRVQHTLERLNFSALSQTRPMGAGRNLCGCCKDGREVPVEITLNPFATSEGTFTLVSIIDITERQLAEERLRQAATVFESTAEGVIITDADIKIIAVNKAFTTITGYSEQEVLGRNPRAFRSGRHHSDFYRDLWTSILESGSWQGEIWDRRKNGEVYPKWLTISVIRDEAGHVINYIGVFSDISQIKRSEEQLAHLAHYDPLTNLPNRLLLNSRLSHALEQAKRQNRKVVLLFLDLDRFKTINDSLGHPAGDELLVAAGRRIRHRLREADTLARLGGDEFVILLEHLNHCQAAAIAQHVLVALSEPFRLASGHEVFVSASIGISIFPDDAQDSTQLVRNADAAMYQAKESGRNTYHFYTEALTHSANQRLDLESRLRRALERKEFILHYQPQVDIATGRIIGVEALVRWQSPEMGLIPPAQFIPLAEETGLIIPLGEWVLRSACAQTKAWLEQGLPPLTVAVNFSSLQFRQSDTVERVRAILEETGLPAAQLELEITESATLEQGEHAQATLLALKALGVRLAIDDFGTGYSSLAYLKRFAFDTVKIDRSFVKDLSESRNDGEIAATVIAMARNLRLTALAEGVETEEQLAFLRDLGCDTYQGYFFSRPQPAEDMAVLLRTDENKASSSAGKCSLTCQ
ncbi:sensor domain-containing protein [Methylocaldum sp.]|uniref:sensor domain-containing protein n=1 Tax=Methylocaldum sp. TaxID=1969727 RepID=UPI002D54D7CC|nr:EAL domain-containing protein [Methylocaldum sp.]HYE35971.1 EAL domain-containing protein [Methylocaldum sp.]